MCLHKYLCNMIIGPYLAKSLHFIIPARFPSTNFAAYEWYGCLRQVSIVTLRVLSHLTCLVRFSRTMVCFLSKSSSFGEVRTRLRTLVRTKQPNHGPPKKTGLGPVPSEPWFDSLLV